MERILKLLLNVSYLVILGVALVAIAVLVYGVFRVNPLIGLATIAVTGFLMGRALYRSPAERREERGGGAEETKP